MAAFLASRSARRILVYPVITLLLGTTLALSASWPFHRHLSLRLSDLLLQQFALHPADDRIVIVGIDGAALSDETGFGARLTEWDRSIYGELLRYLMMAGARVVVFDILFAGNNPQGDMVFAQALGDFSPAILSVVASDDAIHYPTATLRSGHPPLGHANVVADFDNVVRRVPLAVTAGGQSYEALGLHALRLYWQLPPDAALWTVDGRTQLPNGLSAPLDENQNVLLNFSKPGAYILEDCSIGALVRTATREARAELCPDELFRDKIVFVGATALATRDVHFTPVGPMYGVEIHANLAASLLNGSALQEQTPGSRRLVIVGLALLLGVLGMQRNPTVLVIAVVVGVLATLILSIVAYHFFYLRLDVAGPLLTLFCGSATVLAVQNTSQRREQREIITLLSTQISRNISRKLLQAYDRNELVLGGELRTVSVVFIDMRNYTALAETLPPEQVMYLINTYLDIIATELMRYDGTVSQYVGDQAMAIFNAPLEQADHPLRAVRASLAALNAVHEFNCVQRAASPPDEAPLLAAFGAGVNTGEAVAGNIGTNDRYNYTIIGDAVNVAARLCSAAPPGMIYIGQQTIASHPELLREFPEMTPIEPLQVKGKTDPLRVYRLKPNRE
jgi:adenylate cyclase